MSTSEKARERVRLPLGLGAVALAWLAAAYFLPKIAWRALPDGLLAVLSLPTYNMLCQLLTLTMGIGLSALVVGPPVAALRLTRPSWFACAVVSLVAPAVFVAASILAIRIAQPYLLRELATEGAEASRRNAGAFGRAVTEAPLVITLIWGAVLAALSEESLFRGALFGAVRTALFPVFSRRWRASGPPRTADDDWVSGLAAVVVAAVVFGWMHFDMKGSVGIVRVASATCLGLACGTVRLLTGTVLASMLLHMLYNTTSLALGRGWFTSTSEPLLCVIPNRLLVVAAAGAVLACLMVGARRLAAARGARSVVSAERDPRAGDPGQ